MRGPMRRTFRCLLRDRSCVGLSTLTKGRFTNHSSFRVFTASYNTQRYRSPALLEFLDSYSQNYRSPVHYVPANVEDCKNLTAVKIGMEENYTKWMRTAIRMELPKIAIELFHEYWSFNIHPPSERLVSLLFLAHRLFDNIDALLEDVDLVMQLPECIDFSSSIQIIGALSYSGEFDKAYNMFQWLKSTQFGEPLPVLCYNGLLSGADKDQAKKILRDMKGAGVTPNLKTYEYAVRCFRDNAREMEKILPYMVENGVKPTEKFLSRYLEIISTIEAYDNKRLGEIVYQLIEDFDLVPDQAFMNSLMLYYSMVHSPEKAREFLTVCERVDMVNNDTYRAIIQGYFVLEDFQGALRAIQEFADHDDLEFLEDLYNNLLSVAIPQNPVQACELVLLMDQLKITLDEEHYDDLLYEMANDESIVKFRLISEIWQQAVAADAPLTEETMSALIHRAHHFKEDKEVEIFMSYMYDSNMTITQDLMDIFNKPVTSVLDEQAIKFPGMGDFKE
uniref:Pentacotripeptide-repeat region of PRORP domain-containing protein n=1 Tax=Vannella robusta TaxID=1487602 RepID=A0A7S4M7X0_9EUKA